MTADRDSWAVSVEGVGKHYTLGEREHYGALRDSITNAAKALVGRRPPAPPTQSIWACVQPAIWSK